MKWLKSLLLLGVLASLASVATGVYFKRWLDTPIEQPSITFEIPRGASVVRIAQLLQQQGWLEHAKVWALLARYAGLANKFRAGEYQLQTGTTPQQLMTLFSSGNVLLHSLTIVEGSTFAELRQAIAKRDDLEHTINQLSDSELMRKLGDDQHPEGLFFPDTYQFAKNTKDIDVLLMAYQRMQKELDAAWQQRDAELLLNSPYAALILASIVEKETAQSSERPQIAGVFMERLARDMRLQTDPTVIYGLGSSYDGNLRKADLLRDTPYNTYTRTGLPPTPICLPGAAALRAAVQPKRDGSLYFVATGTNGGHYFSKTLDEHNAAVRRYLNTLRGS